MRSLDSVLLERLDDIRRKGLFRELRRIDSPQSTRIRIQGRDLLNFSSNDYLGLANHPTLREAAIHGLNQHGNGSGASRLICGSLSAHHELEEALADFKKCDAAISFSSGYAAAMGAICALMGKNDIIILDKLVHACIVDASRLSGAKLRVFAHNDFASLERVLLWAQKRVSLSTEPTPPNILVITESAFSMDGDLAPLKEIVELKERHGAWLMVDEAHATGVFGTDRSGLVSSLNLSRRVEVQMGTLGKALGSSGGFICGSKTLVDFLVNKARSFIFSTAPLPSVAVASLAGIKLVQSGAGMELCRNLWNNIETTTRFLRGKGWNPGNSASAILPLMVGDESKAIQAFHKLQAEGIFIPAVRYPTVSLGKARLRLTLSAAHTKDDLGLLESALEGLTPPTQDILTEAQQENDPDFDET